nr:serine/threonine-protein phosphatase PP-X isozyme 2 [Tanacetum cinerariifolium]
MYEAIAVILIYYVRRYGFYDECLRKYSSVNIWRYCTDIFDYLSLSTLVEIQLLSFHGGLSLTINKIDQVWQRSCNT